MSDDPRHPLDDPVRTSLLGAHARHAQRHGDAVRYDPEVAPFLARLTPGAWDDVAALIGPGGVATSAGEVPDPPPGWLTVMDFPGVQLVGERVRASPDAEAVVLGPDDVPEMTALIARTRPGPFAARTVTLGTYLGLRRDGELVAMAGERLRPPGWTEISAVCTAPEHRGHGLATRLVRALVAGIRDRGEIPFLHTTATNTTAIALYESMGFRQRWRPSFVSVRAPAAIPARI